MTLYKKKKMESGESCTKLTEKHIKQIINSQIKYPADTRTISLRFKTAYAKIKKIKYTYYECNFSSSIHF